MTKTQQPEIQLEIYQQAVQALGGIRAHARALGMAERHGARLYSGNRAVTVSILADTAAALIDHADLCRQLERQISPAFGGNLTPAQQERQGRPDARVQRGTLAGDETSPVEA